MDTPVEGSGPSILDINILPPRYRRRGLNWKAALPWLICVALGLLLLPSVYLLTASYSEYLQAREASSQAEQSLESHQPFIEDRETLITELEQLRMQSAQIKAAAQSAVIQEIRWGDVIGAILDAQSEAVELTALDQSENDVLISGSAADHALVLTLGERLTESAFIRAITVNSIEQYFPSQSTGAGDGGESRPLYRFEISAQVQP